MTVEELVAILNGDEGEGGCAAEYLNFDAVQNKRSKRPDIHAFLLLDELVPGDRDMVSSASHDEIWLDVEIDELAKVITPEQAVELVRYGVRESDDSLCMFA